MLWNQQAQTDRTIPNNKPDIARFFAHVQTGPGAHPASCTMGTGSFPGVKLPGRGADHSLLVPRLRMGRATPLPPLQGHEACNRVNFTFYIVTSDNEKGTFMLIDVAIPRDRNVIQREAEKVLNYKDLTIEVERMWNVNTRVIPVIIGATGTISK
jgi:hypothetical protein